MTKLEIIEELIKNSRNKKNAKGFLDYYQHEIGNKYTWNTKVAFMTTIADNGGYYVISFANNNEDELKKEIAATSAVLEAELYEIVQMKELFPFQYQRDVETLYEDARRYVQRFI